MPDVEELQELIADDQFEWGEFGRSEASERTPEEAARKPNFFISCHAAYALVATGAPNHEAVRRLLRWTRSIRGDDGHWTSAAGRAAPRGGGAAGQVRNVRHTAKGLDLMLLRDELRADDAKVLRYVLSQRASDGGWPAHPDEESDLWATAYVLNLFARLIARPTEWLAPAGTTLESWLGTLRTNRDQALAWLVDELGDADLWRHPGQNPLFTTEAVLAEAGGLLADARPDICERVANRLLDALDRGEKGMRGPTSLWSLGLTWDALDARLQGRVISRMGSALANAADGMDVLDLASMCRLQWLDGDPGLLGYLVERAGGHESVLAEWSPWARNEYERWCITQAEARVTAGHVELSPAPARRAQLWLSALALIERWRDDIERSSGWRGLWDGARPMAEAGIQELFRSFAVGHRAALEAVVVREPETGRGPVDFTFINGVSAEIYMEFKRAGHARLMHGAEVQLPTYMAAGRVDSGFFVCVAFDVEDIAAYQAVEEAIDARRGREPGLFIRSVLIDARPKAPASRA